MHTPCSSPKLPRTVRGACLVASTVVTFGTQGGLLLGWHLQAEPVWLAATPAVLAEVAGCERIRVRPARLLCMRTLVLARAQQSQAVVLASR